MSILASELKAFAATSHPTADAQNSGGPIQDDGHASGGYLVEYTDIAANDDLEYVSDGADTRNAVVDGRDAAGVAVQETKTLNGVTTVNGTQVFERVSRIELSAKDAARTATVKRQPGGATVKALGINIRGVTRTFIGATTPAAGSTKRYELVYLKNTNGTLTLTTAQVRLTTDPALKIKMAVRGSKGDHATALTDRVQATPPESLTFVDDNTYQAVPTNTLAAGERIGVWVEQTLTSGDASFKDTFTLELSGNTT